MSKKLLGKFGIFQVSHRSQLTHSRQHTCFPTQARPITWTSSDTVCASAAERNWSVYGQIKTASRGTMGHAVADKRVYCHEALHNPDYNFTSKARREVGHGLGHGRVRRRGGPRRVNGVQAV